MFTGIVQSTGEVVKIEDRDGARRVWVRAPLLRGAQTGASVAVSGVCLTVIETDGEVCVFDVTAETLSRTTLGTAKAGSRLNLERPLRAGDELGGHIVQGHVDAVGRIVEVGSGSGGPRLAVEVPPPLIPYLVEKGSITLDGVSLTIAVVSGGRLEVALVPHTIEVTTLGDAEVGQGVNVEVDFLAKHVRRLIEPYIAPYPAGGPDESGYL